METRQRRKRAACQVRKGDVWQRAASPFGWWRQRAAALGVSQGSGVFGLRAVRVNAGRRSGAKNVPIATVKTVEKEEGVGRCGIISHLASRMGS
jgi:hypothetical protein